MMFREARLVTYLYSVSRCSVEERADCSHEHAMHTPGSVTTAECQIRVRRRVKIADPASADISSGGVLKTYS